MNKALIYIGLAVVPLFFLQVSLADDFKLVKEKNSIALYERWIMYNGKRVRELKADFSVEDTKAEKLEMLLKNASKGTQWNGHAKQYRVIPGETAQAWQVYVQYDMPWPIKDMDCHLAYQVQNHPEDSQQTVISFKEAESNQFPETSDFNRITGTEGKWIVRQQGDGLTVTYLIKTDRNSDVPGWVSDPIVHENLFQTISELKKILEED